MQRDKNGEATSLILFTHALTGEFPLGFPGIILASVAMRVRAGRYEVYVRLIYTYLQLKRAMQSDY